MAACGYCNATILFGGRRVGDVLYCSTHHALLGRALAQTPDASDLTGLRELLRDTQDDLLALADEVRQQRAAVSDASERLDFLERVVAQVRAAGDKAQ